MQLDKTRIVIRERSYLDLLDLALQVYREHAAPVLITSALSAAPMIAINYFLLGDFLADLDLEYDQGTIFGFLICLSFLIVLEAPVASALTTLYLSQALFLDRPSFRRMLADLWASKWQLFLLQVLGRAVLVPWILSWLLLYAVWPYLTEVILLERNPLRRKSAAGMTTFSRSSALHGPNSGDLFARWLLAGLSGGLMILGMWLAVWYLRGLLTNAWAMDAWMFTLHLQLVTWLVLSYFTVVRFLSYLDLRIRNEGWEIELRMRAEAARLTSHAT